MNNDQEKSRDGLLGVSKINAPSHQQNSDLQTITTPKFENGNVELENTEQGYAAHARFKEQQFEDEKTIELWLRGRSPHTVRAYLRVAEELIQYLGLQQRSLLTCRAEDTIDFVNLKSSWEKNTVTQRAAIVKSLFSFGVKVQRLKTNVSLAITLRRPEVKISENTPTKDETMLMIEKTVEPRDKALIMLLYSSAGRRFEIRNLKVSDFTPRASGGAKVSILGKGSKRRTVNISLATWLAVKTIIPPHALPSDFVFFTDYGATRRQMSESTIYNIVKRAALRAGIVRPMSPHKLRHGHATDALAKGATLRLLQETLGHSDPSTTAIYARVNPEESSGDFLEV